MGPATPRHRNELNALCARQSTVVPYPHLPSDLARGDDVWAGLAGIKTTNIYIYISHTILVWYLPTFGGFLWYM